VLREELAGWFVSLGEPALAAATLRPLVPEQGGPDAQALLVRIGVLLARAGEARAANDAFSDAIEADATDPLAAEIRGSLAAWAPAAVGPDEAARSYLVAAARRDAKNDRAGAFEDLMRAFESAPANAEAAEALAGALVARGRSGAADEIAREHAEALGDGRRAAHLRRLRKAVKDGDLPRALGAAFDARLDAEIDLLSVLAAIDPVQGAEDSALGIDGLLERAGLHELLAARVEVASDFLAGRELARARLALGRLYTGPLGRPDRAVEAWIEALVADPGCEPARDALRRHAVVTRDQSPLVEALIRVGDARGSGGQAERVDCLRELATLAEERIGDPGLALWALQRMAQTGAASGDLDAAIARLAPRARLQDEALGQARAELAGQKGAERLGSLARLAAILQGRPDATDAYVGVLGELIEISPEDRSHSLAAERALVRVGRHAELEVLLARQLSRASSGVERARIRLVLATLKRRRGDPGGALEELLPLLSEPGAHGAAYNFALLLAAQQKQDGARAQALVRIAGQLAPSLRAVLTAVAADELLRAGNVDAARLAAEQAANADPSLARPAAARARVGVVMGGRPGAEAVERAMSIVVPRPALCAALAATYEELGEPLLAAAWAQRLGALRPGDLAAGENRVRRALAGEDGARLADTLAWLLSQPQSLSPAAGIIAEAIVRLGEIAPGRAAALARRALDVLGPRDQRLRAAALDVADRVGERGLGIAVVERWLATGSLGTERGAVLLDLSRRRKAAGDADGAARALCRALSEGAPPRDVMAELDTALPTRSSDGEIALLRARAETLSALPEADRQGTAQAWRELGAALWDFAGDQAGAQRAWDRALSLDAERGIENLASDWIAFAGEGPAIERLIEHARKREGLEAARFYGVAAMVAFGCGRQKDAFDLAHRTLSIDPARTDAIAIAERAAADTDLDALEGLYDHMATASLGHFGERAIRYRAARQLERRGLAARAMKHAIHAFEAVPSEGVVFVTLARLADRTDQRAEMVRAIERVAERSEQPGVRSGWLRRAALFAGESEEGERQRVDVLLRALSVRAEVDLVASLATAMANLVRLAPDERDAAELRFRRAALAVLSRGDGPEGARIAIEVALAALVTFGAGALAVEALVRGAECDGDLEHFALLVPHAGALAALPEAATLLAKLTSLAGQKFASLGPPLLELGAEIAAARGDDATAAVLLVSAAERDPERLELVRRAEVAAKKVGDPKLIERVLDAMPDRGRFALLMDLAAAADKAEEFDRALDAIERARQLVDVLPEQRRVLFERAQDLLVRLGRRDELEALLTGELARPELPVELVPRVARELASLIGARGRPLAALDVLSGALERLPDHPELLADTALLARQAGAREKEAWALGRLVDLGADPGERKSQLRELAALLDSLSEESAALSRWSELHALDPSDPEALAALERDAERRGDYEALVRLLDRRAAIAGRVDDVRKLRLRRATVLEQRLGRPDEARSELEALASATGDHLSVLRVLADLCERLGDPLRAAAVWLRAAALATGRDEAAELSRRACQAHLAGGDVEGAHRVLEGMGAWVERSQLLELDVEIERRRENPAGLGDALDELATTSREPEEQRARLLVEAARAALVAGDGPRSLERATRAARMAPALAEAQLLAKKLEYVAHGPGGEVGARATLEALRSMQGELSPEQAELSAFLVAEALESVEGEDPALRFLEAERARLGPRPLIALGIAERLAARGESAAALEAFDHALGGDLQGVRRPSRVALAAGEAARRAGDLDRADACFELAALDGEVEGIARGALEVVRSERAAERELAQSGRAPPRSDPPPIPLVRTAPVRASSKPPDSDVERAHVVIQGDDDAPAVEPARLLSLDPPKTTVSIEPSAVLDGPPPSALFVSQKPASPRRTSLSGTFAGSTEEEVALHLALAEGSREAGEQLFQLLEGDPERAHDLVTVCRRLALLVPGDPLTLARLARAARDDRNVTYANAVEHVLDVVRPAPSPPRPPLLESVNGHPDAVRGLLFREIESPTLEALALVWDTAEHLFRRDPGAYGITGLERIQPTAPTLLAHAYAGTSRALGALRVPLFQRRTAGPVTVGVALLSPPAVVLSGDVQAETAQLHFHLGAMLAAASPQLIMLFGLPEAQARSVLRALAFAFGPSRPDASVLGPALNLAEMLWESIPARPQRRLRELCHDPVALDYDQAMQQARIAVRRAGLFVAGDFAVAAREICSDEGLDTDSLRTPEGLGALCRKSPSLGSLYALSLSPEYAEIRWQGARGGARP
jgi:tetratricopeptide (TPR) repeat protein